MTVGMSIVGGLRPDSGPQENRQVGAEIGDAVDAIRHHRLRASEDARGNLAHRDNNVGDQPNPSDASHQRDGRGRCGIAGGHASRISSWTVFSIPSAASEMEPANM
jgi:hypothetical protein